MSPVKVLEMLTDDGAAERKGVTIFGKVSLEVYNMNRRRERRFDRVVRFTRDTLFVANSVIVLSANSILHAALETQLLRLASIGFVARNNRLLLDRQAGGAPTSEAGDGVQVLEVQHVLGAFEIWACMVAAAVGLFALECWSVRMDARVRGLFG